MASNTRLFIFVPNDVQDPIALKRFLVTLVERLDEIVRQHGSLADITKLNIPQLTVSPTYNQAEVQQIADDIQTLQAKLNELIDIFKS